MGEWRAEQRFQGPGVERRFLGSATGSVVSCLGGLHSPCECVSRSLNADTFVTGVGRSSVVRWPSRRSTRERGSASLWTVLLLSLLLARTNLPGGSLAVRSRFSRRARPREVRKLSG